MSVPAHRLALVPVFVNFINEVVESDETILDVGCGALRDVFRVRLGVRYQGLEVPDCPHPKDYAGDAENLPFSDGSFDIVTAWSVVEHLTNPFIGLSEMIRVARRLVLVSTDYTDKDKDGDPTHLYSWTQTTFRHFLTKSGYAAEVWVGGNILFGKILK